MKVKMGDAAQACTERAAGSGVEVTLPGEAPSRDCESARDAFDEGLPPSEKRGFPRGHGCERPGGDDSSGHRQEPGARSERSGSPQCPRTHHCHVCGVSFKSNGNLVKHIKSKLHGEQCLELGLTPKEQEVTVEGEGSDEGNRGSEHAAEEPDEPEEEDGGSESRRHAVQFTLPVEQPEPQPGPSGVRTSRTAAAAAGASESPTRAEQELRPVKPVTATAFSSQTFAGIGESPAGHPPAGSGARDLPLDAGEATGAAYQGRSGGPQAVANASVTPATETLTQAGSVSGTWPGGTTDAATAASFPVGGSASPLETSSSSGRATPFPREAMPERCHQFPRYARPTDEMSPPPPSSTSVSMFASSPPSPVLLPGPLLPVLRPSSAAAATFFFPDAGDVPSRPGQYLPPGYGAAPSREATLAALYARCPRPERSFLYSVPPPPSPVPCRSPGLGGAEAAAHGSPVEMSPRTPPCEVVRMLSLDGPPSPLETDEGNVTPGAAFPAPGAPYLAARYSDDARTQPGYTLVADVIPLLLPTRAESRAIAGLGSAKQDPVFSHLPLHSRQPSRSLLPVAPLGAIAPPPAAERPQLAEATTATPPGGSTSRTPEPTADGHAGAGADAAPRPDRARSPGGGLTSLPGEEVPFGGPGFRAGGAATRLSPSQLAGLVQPPVWSATLPRTGASPLRGYSSVYGRLAPARTFPLDAAPSFAALGPALLSGQAPPPLPPLVPHVGPAAHSGLVYQSAGGLCALSEAPAAAGQGAYLVARNLPSLGIAYQPGPPGHYAPGQPFPPDVLARSREGFGARLPAPAEEQKASALNLAPISHAVELPSAYSPMPPPLHVAYPAGWNTVAGVLAPSSPTLMFSSGKEFHEGQVGMTFRPLEQPAGLMAAPVPTQGSSQTRFPFPFADVDRRRDVTSATGSSPPDYQGPQPPLMAQPSLAAHVHQGREGCYAPGQVPLGGHRSPPAGAASPFRSFLPQPGEGFPAAANRPPLAGLVCQAGAEPLLPALLGTAQGVLGVPMVQLLLPATQFSALAPAMTFIPIQGIVQGPLQGTAASPDRPVSPAGEHAGGPGIPAGSGDGGHPQPAPTSPTPAVACSRCPRLFPSAALLWLHVNATHAEPGDRTPPGAGAARAPAAASPEPHGARTFLAAQAAGPDGTGSVVPPVMQTGAASSVRSQSLGGSGGRLQAPTRSEMEGRESPCLREHQGHKESEQGSGY